jgi:hypothetical protein
VAKETFYTPERQEEYCNGIASHFNSDVITAKQVSEYNSLKNLPYPYFLTMDKKRSAGWGKYRVRGQGEAPVKVDKQAVSKAVFEEMVKSFVPEKSSTYIPFGFFNDCYSIINSKIFYPVYVTGLSGNGKTEMIIQACAKAVRELIRVNITKDTHELDLMGSNILVDGNTFYQEGPVITAMKRGAILLLDETDLGSERLLCLQPVLEGKPVLNKKTGEIVHPKEGFNIFATANTKGQGNADGRFIGTNTLNEAFLERFAITVEQEYPNEQTETKILEKNFEELGIELATHKMFLWSLINWAQLVRKSYAEGAVGEIISTRRLIHIVKAYSIFKNKKKSVTLCLNRFDEETKVALVDFWDKVFKEEPKPVDPNEKVMPPGTTKATQNKERTDIEFVPVSGVMTNKFKTPVALKAENDPIGKKVLAVYSHNNKTTKPMDQLPNPTSVREFEMAVQRMVEANSIGGAA